MNPVVLAAVALSLVAFGAVASTSLSAQQSASSASTQKIAQERDRLLEQTNAYVSAVAPSGGNTQATIKNTGASTITIDHCLALAPSTGNLKPTATTIRVNQVVNTGKNYNVTLTGTVAADNIKCVTSKGTVLPVKLDAAAANSAPNSSVTDDLGIYSVSAKVVPGTKIFTNNASYKPSGIPSPNYSSTPAGSLIWSVPVVSQITVTQVLRYDTSGNPIDISSGLTGTYAANSQIQIPIPSPISKIAIKYTNSAGLQNTANIYPQTIARFTGSSSLSASSASLNTGQRCTSTNSYSCNGAYLIVEKYASLPNYVYSPPTVDPNDGQQVGLAITNYYCAYYYCTDPTTLETGNLAYSQDQYGRYWGYRYYAQLSSADYSYYYTASSKTLNTTPEIVDVFSFLAPAPSFAVTLSFSRDASISGIGAQSGYGVPTASTYTKVDATNFSASSILPGSITITWPANAFKTFSGSEHRDGTYQFRIENVQAGQQVQVRVAHGVLASLQNPNSAYYNSYGWYDDSMWPTISGSTTLTISS
jgi:hypothetical protein